MKKLLIYITGLVLLFTASVMIAAVYAETATNSPVDELLDEAKNKPKEAIAQDLYLRMYKKMNADPAKSATKNSATKFKMSEEDIKKVTKQGDLAPLFGKDKNPTLDTINEKYSKVYEEYQTSLATENLKADLTAAADPGEVFADGDTSNSEFDLLYDLTVIEVILFNESSVSSFGGEFQMPDFDFSDPEETAAINELFGNEEAAVNEDVIETISEQEDKEFNALECLPGEENNIGNALNDFENDQSGSQTGTTGEQNNLGDAVLGEDGFPIAETDEWLKTYLCPDGAFFCIDIEFDVKSSKVYSKTDNCVACHVSNINKEMDKLIGKPLSPNKVSGNIFEVTKCKSAFSNIGANMNVITVAVPPPNQAKTDLMNQLNIEKEWTNFQEKYKMFFYDTNTQQPEQSLTDRAYNKALTNSSPEKPLNELVTKSEEISNSKTTEQNKEQTTKDKELTAEIQNKQFQNLIVEMDSFNTYFNSIKDLLTKMVEACNELANKPYCS